MPENMYKNIYNLIKQYNTIIIQRHQKPDGDALGSQIGLKKSILLTFPNKNVFAVGEESDYLNFAEKMDDISDDTYNDALVIVVDTGAEHLISDKRYTNGKLLIKIDHHIPQGDYGDIRLVDTSCESCCSIITQLIKNTKLKIDSDIATYLYLGMVTDSGRFRFQSTTSNTFLNAAYLLENGADFDFIFKNIYTDNLNNVLLKAKMTLKYEVLDSGVAFLKNNYQTCIDFNIEPYTLGKTTVNLMSGVKEVSIWGSFTELSDGKVVIELRSNKFDINQIAVKYGGGGHLQASGTTVDNWNVADQVINDLVLLSKGEYIC